MNSCSQFGGFEAELCVHLNNSLTPLSRVNIRDYIGE